MYQVLYNIWEGKHVLAWPTDGFFTPCMLPRTLNNAGNYFHTSNFIIWNGFGEMLKARWLICRKGGNEEIASFPRTSVAGLWSKSWGGWSEGRGGSLKLQTRVVNLMALVGLVMLQNGFYLYRIVVLKYCVLNVCFFLPSAATRNSSDIHLQLF